MNLQYALLNDTSWQSQADWQLPDTPFMSFAFWQALIDTGAIGERAGWLPIFILVYRTDDSESEALDDPAKTTITPADISQSVAVMPIIVANSSLITHGHRLMRITASTITRVW